MGKNKKIIAAVVVILLVILGAGGMLVNAQIQGREAIAESEALAESERIAESERVAESESIAESERLAESEALAKAEQEKEVLDKLEASVNALYADESKKLLATDISQDKIKEVETLLTELESKEFSSENKVKLDSLITDFSDAKNMFSVSKSLKELTVEVAITDEGAKKIEDIQKALDDLKEGKLEFVKSLQVTLDTLKSDISYIKNVKDNIRSLFTDDTYSTVADGITRDTFLSVVSLKDGIGVESIRLALEEKLMVVSNYLETKDAETTQGNTSSATNSSTGSSATASNNSSNSTNNSSSSSSNATNNSSSNSSNTTNNGGSSSTNTTNTEATQPEAQRQPVWVVDVAAYDEPVYSNQNVYDTHPICNGCGISFNTVDEAITHSGEKALEGDLYHSYSSIREVVGQEQIQTGTIHHEEQGHWE